MRLDGRGVERELAIENLDAVLCYQSRVGPLRWIGPDIWDEISRAGRDKVPAIIVPIAFVSEHSETLVELDIDYRHLAESCGVPSFTRVSTVGASHEFIAGLAQLVFKAQGQTRGLPYGRNSASVRELILRLSFGIACPMNGSRPCMSFLSSAGWRACCICRGFMFIMRRPQPVPNCPRR